MGACCSISEKGQEIRRNPLWTDQLQLGKYTLKNRIFLAAMTRVRCDPKTGIPNDLLVQYYGQRAGAGLLLTECASWSPRGISYPGAGDIYNRQQAEGWKKVTDEVHKRGGRIFLQIFHGGRVTHRDINGGFQPLAPSAVAVRGEKIHSLGGISYPTPKEMTLEDIRNTQKQFEESLKLAKLANFDGIELHAANGYLIDQFLRSHTNRRKDHYGGSAQNRVKFAVELVDIALKYFESYQIGIKVSPTSRFNDLSDEKPIETYTQLLKQLEKRQIGFVEIVESQENQQGPSAEFHVPGIQQIEDVSRTLRPHFSRLLIANNGFNAESGLKKISQGTCDGISFGKLYISNPDLAQRIIGNATLNTNFDFKTFYGVQLEDKSKGYTDYPIYTHQ